MLLDLAFVTETLISLIEKWIAASPEVTKVTPLLVSAQPPDKLTGDHTIGVYLYHIVEDAHYKNLAPPSDEVPPVRFMPMGLDLHYLVTPHSDLRENTGTLSEQTLMGLALKALRDYPCIDDSTVIGGVKVLPDALQGFNNRFRIVLQPTQHTEAMSYWTAGTLPLRLAAYYSVSVALLESQPSLRRPSRVLTFGLFSGGSAPHLGGSRSDVTFTVPGTPPRTIEVQPAQVPLSGRVTFFGSDLAADQTTLLITSALTPGEVEVGSDWGVLATDSEIQAVIQPVAGTRAMVPGVYSAVARVVEHRLMPDMTARDLVKTSNATPFVIAPAVTAIDPPDGAQRVVVHGGIFQNPAIAADAIDVFVGPHRLSLRASAVLNPGEFEILNPSQLRFRFPVADVLPGTVVQFRLLINGAESAPHWVTAP